MKLEKVIDEIAKSGTRVWGELKKTRDFNLWWKVGEALQALQQEAMNEAGITARSNSRPAGIVFNSHFFEFFDWSVWLLFETALGVPPNQLGSAFGIVGIPLVDAKARFLKPAKFNDVADIASEVSEFRRSSFDVAHRISIGGELAVEGSETRVWAGRDPDDPVKLKGMPIPAAVIARFRAAA